MQYTIRKMAPQEIPKPLWEIPQPPEQLYIVGTLPSTHIYVSVVGSRRFSDYGEKCCRELILGLRGKNIAIVSGLAYGIDKIAHKAAIEAGLPTIAIPGSGLDVSVLYPRAHVSLAEEVLQCGGCLLSEFDPKTKAAPWMFPMRNRIMAGLSKAVLVIEAEEKSGTLITARLAAEYNRDVLAVPGSIFSATSAGTNFLIRQGATPITSSDELLDALGLKEILLPFEKIEHEKRNDLSEDEKNIVKLLKEAPLTREELSFAIKKRIYETCAIISILEIKGIIEEKFGRLWLTR